MSSAYGVISSYSIKKVFICCVLSLEDVSAYRVCYGMILLLKCFGISNINLHTRI